MVGGAGGRIEPDDGTQPAVAFSSILVDHAAWTVWEPGQELDVVWWSGLHGGVVNG